NSSQAVPQRRGQSICERARSGASNNSGGYHRDKRTNLEILDEISTQNGLGSPSYQVQCHELLETNTGVKSNWFLGK
uniref:Ovule protein n=1 Tax=Macrostomum lignano TaxID=282301 RepID=A0A1I8FKA0_9PLAT